MKWFENKKEGPKGYCKGLSTCFQRWSLGSIHCTAWSLALPGNTPKPQTRSNSQTLLGKAPKPKLKKKLRCGKGNVLTKEYRSDCLLRKRNMMVCFIICGKSWYWLSYLPDCRVQDAGLLLMCSGMSNVNKLFFPILISLLFYVVIL